MTNEGANSASVLAASFSKEFGLAPGATLDPYNLPACPPARTHGAGVERLFSEDAVQQAVLSRIMAVYTASAASWQPADMYFVMRRWEPIGTLLCGATECALAMMAL